MTNNKKYGMFRRMGRLATQKYFVKQVKKLNQYHTQPEPTALLVKFVQPSKWWRWPQINYILFVIFTPNKLYSKLRDALYDSIGDFLGYDDDRKTLRVTPRGNDLLENFGFIPTGFINETLRKNGPIINLFIGLGGGAVLYALISYLWQLTKLYF